MKKTPDYFYALCILCIYFIVKYLFISLAYLDFGDGNYLYISWRLSQGEILYRDIISPQPPVMLYFWSIWHRIFPEIISRVQFFRATAIVIHMAAGWMVFLLARLLFNNRAAGLLALIIYLVQPIGFWWFRCIQSEPLGIVFMLISIYYLLQPTRKSALFVAGIFFALAVGINMIFLPYYILVIIILLCYRPENMKTFFISSLALLASIFLIMTLASGFAVWDNVFLNQFKTYKGDPSYFIHKIKVFGGIIIHLEAAAIILFFAGLFQYMKKTAPSYQSVLIALLSLQGFGSYFFITKGGTVDYIFSLAEPFLAIFAAYAFLKIFFYFATACKERWPYLVKIICAVGYLHFLIVILYSPIRYNTETLQGKNYEADVETVTKVVGTIRRNSHPDDQILAPPYYAFIAQRTIVENISSTYIFHMKYLGEDQEALETVERLVQKIENKELPIILLNTRQLGRIDPLRKAIRNNYSIIDTFETRHEYIEVYLPHS